MDRTYMVLLRAITLSTMLVVASALTALAGTAPSDRPLFMIAATGSPGSTYYEYGQALASCFLAFSISAWLRRRPLGREKTYS